MAVPSLKDDLEQVEIDLLLGGLARQFGYDFRGYARASLSRRMRLAMQREGVRSISMLQHLVLHDEDARERFLRHLTVHVTSMFRDADFFRAFRKEVVPQLRTYPVIRIWHAGCATGEEVYSMAVLLEEEGLYDRARLYATDISDRALEQASRGVFPLDTIRKYTELYYKAGGIHDFSRYYVTDAEYAIMAKSLRRNVIFSRHNLATDGSFNEFSAIVCRNVMIYFGNELRDRAQALLDGSLVRFGYLCLGKKESLSHTAIASKFEELPSRVRIYRRNG